MYFGISKERSIYYIFSHTIIGMIMGMMISTIMFNYTCLSIIPDSVKNHFDDKALLSKVSNYIDTEDKKVILGGQNLFLEPLIKGVLIAEISRNDTILEINDIITHVNSIEITSLEQFRDVIEANGTNDINLIVKRENINFKTTITSLNNDGVFDIGFSVTQYDGNATITFIDPELMKFASAGHEVITFENVNQDVSWFIFDNLTKSTPNNIGVMDGYGIDNTIGQIQYTNYTGAYGIFNEDVSKDSEITQAKSVELGTKDEVEEGNATIYCSIDKEGIKGYDVKISYKNILNNQKYFEIEFIDSDLLEKAGGGICGMSGSPIVQNGKIIGALSTVNIDNPTKGNAIYIDYMIASMYNIK